MQDKMNNKFRLICSCGTIWPVCEMPITIDELSKAMNKAKCPTCNKNSKTACIYVEKKDA